MKRKQGISLIVLVITIIVMIILAAAVVISLSNSDIISKSNQAVKKTNAKQIEQLASLAWSEAYMDGARTEQELKKAVEDALVGIDTSDITIKVTVSGVNVQEGKQEPKVVPENLKAYVLGTNGNKKMLDDILNFDTYMFIDDTSTSENESEEITFQGVSTTSDATIIYLQIKYKDNYYEIVADMNTYEVKDIQSIELVKYATEIEQYLYGKFGKGRMLPELVDMETGVFVDDPETTVNESEVFEGLIVDFATAYSTGNAYVKYENAVYKITMIEHALVTKGFEKIYEKQGREGDVIDYDSNGDNKMEEWIILTDRDNKVEIVSASAMKKSNNELAKVSIENTSIVATTDVDGNGEINNDGDRAILIYNDSIKIINDYCKEVVGIADKTKIRSIGAASEETGIPYSSEAFNASYKGSVAIKALDLHYEQDVVRLAYFGKLNVGEEYCIASRFGGFDESEWVEFGLRVIDEKGKMYGYNKIMVHPNGEVEGLGGSYAVRPVIINPVGLN